MRRTLALLALPVLAFHAACAGDDAAPDAPAADSAAATERTTPLKALAASQSLEIRTALSSLNRAMLDFYVLNDRYPHDAAELEASQETAPEFATVRDASDSLSYTARDGGYRLVVHVRNAPPLTMEAPAPTLQPEAP
jgi:hypothetical protein